MLGPRQHTSNAQSDIAHSLRSVRVHIDLTAIRHNLDVARTLSGSRVFAVIKADAYGHGAATVAEALTSADGFAVVTTGEAMALREAGISKPVLVLQGPRQSADCAAYLEHALWPVIHDLEQYGWFKRVTVAAQLGAWLKVDTGMGRLGVFPDVAKQLLTGNSPISWKGVLSHLACADEPGNAHTQTQIRAFAAGRWPQHLATSLANSAAIIAWPDARHDWARPGIMLYGSNPLLNAVSRDLKLRPAMHVTAPLFAIKHFDAGAGIGYAQAWVCAEPMRVGFAAIGYADGLPRVLDASATVLIGGKRCPIIGRVSMDSIAIDLRSLADAAVGDPVTLWGPDHPVELMAAAAGTIAYELLTGIKGARTYTS